MISRAIETGEHTVLKCAFGEVRLLTSLGLCSPAGEGILCADPKVTSCVRFLSGPRILVVWEGLPPNPLTPNPLGQHAENSRVLLLDLLRGSSASQLKLPLVRGSRHFQIGKSCPWLRVGPTRGSWEEWKPLQSWVPQCFALQPPRPRRLSTPEMLTASGLRFRASTRASLAGRVQPLSLCWYQEYKRCPQMRRKYTGQKNRCLGNRGLAPHRRLLVLPEAGLERVGTYMWPVCPCGGRCHGNGTTLTLWVVSPGLVDVAWPLHSTAPTPTSYYQPWDQQIYLKLESGTEERNPTNASPEHWAVSW